MKRLGREGGLAHPVCGPHLLLPARFMVLTAVSSAVLPRKGRAGWQAVSHSLQCSLCSHLGEPASPEVGEGEPRATGRKRTVSPAWCRIRGGFTDPTRALSTTPCALTHSPRSGLWLFLCAGMSSAEGEPTALLLLSSVSHLERSEHECRH